MSAATQHEVVVDEEICVVYAVLQGKTWKVWANSGRIQSMVKAQRNPELWLIGKKRQITAQMNDCVV